MCAFELSEKGIEFFMIRILLLATIIPIYVIYKIYKLIDGYRFDKIQEQYFVEKSEMQKAEYKKDEIKNDNFLNSNNNFVYKVIQNFRKQDYVMEYEELKFYRELKKIADKRNWVIFPQVSLYHIVSVNDKKRFNQLFPLLKGKSIDFVICDEKNFCKIIMCVELEGSTNNKIFKESNDKFKDELFEEVGTKFIRIKRESSYSQEDLIKKLDIEQYKNEEEQEKTYFTSQKSKNKNRKLLIRKIVLWDYLPY